MQYLGTHQRIEQLALPGGGTAAPNVQTSGHAVAADKNGAPGSGRGILRLADGDVFYGCYRYFFHILSPVSMIMHFFG